MRDFRILIAGGGTGGHLFPALAIGEEILSRNPHCKIHYVGSIFGLESKVFPIKDVWHTLLPIRGIQRDLSMKSLFRNSLLPYRIILSFYKYVFISNPGIIRDKLFLFWDSINILGRIYIANEGINAQLSVPKSNFEKFKLHLQKFVLFQDVKLNIAHKHEIKSFLKLKIKVKNKIVADGIDNHDFDPSKTGTHLDANDFNNLMNDKNTLVLDMRNHYESEIGHFKGAICPDVDTFRDSLEIIEKNLKYKKNKNLLMYCTGGIRCEKASAYFKFKGFKNVFQSLFFRNVLTCKERALLNYTSLLV